MPRERPSLGTPYGTDGPWLQAILDVLGDLHDLLDERLPRGEGPARVTEPAPPARPERARPITEPAPESPPDRALPMSEPGPGEPDADDDAGDALPSPPPMVGRGSSLEAWQRWARLAKVPVGRDASRSDIIAACRDAGVLPRHP